MKKLRFSLVVLFVFIIFLLPAISQESQPDLIKAQVTRVVDGDTIKVIMPGGNLDTVRYIGIDTPETVHPEKPVECFGKEASAYNDALVGDKTVWLELDVEERDKYGRLLAYVYLDPKGRAMVNVILVAQGYAQVATYPPNVKYVELFRELAKGAREDGRGLWAEDVCEDKNDEDEDSKCEQCLEKLNNASHADFKAVSRIGDTLAKRLVEAKPFDPPQCKDASSLEAELQKIPYIASKRSEAVVKHFCPELY